MTTNTPQPCQYCMSSTCAGNCNYAYMTKAIYAAGLPNYSTVNYPYGFNSAGMIGTYTQYDGDLAEFAKYAELPDEDIIKTLVAMKSEYIKRAEAEYEAHLTNVLRLCKKYHRNVSRERVEKLKSFI